MRLRRKVKEDIKLSPNAMYLLKRRYLLKDDNKNITETPSELFRRAAYNVSQAERNFKSPFKASEIEEKFYQIMYNLEFLPNSPTLMNAGTFLNQLSACFVLPVEDSIEGIFESLKTMAQIHKSGGGTGFSFSHLRPKGNLVASTKGEASGPVSFMSIYNQATGVIVQGGRRRGANMGILRCDHPDIMDFIEAKKKEGSFVNFNLSVGATDKFIDAVRLNKNFNLVNPRTKKTVRKVKARAIFDAIAKAAWHSGDPGLVFLDEINRKHSLRKMGKIEAMNPCGELPLLPYESCNLGSINLTKVVKAGRIDWEKLKELVRLGIRFLDDVIEVNKFPLSRIKEITSSNRKIGFGIMGFADMLIGLGIPYTSKKAVEVAKAIMSFIHNESLNASHGLAKERGVFRNYRYSIYAKKNFKIRNATVNTIAPTGSISIIAGCSSGIEPIFAVTFLRNVLSGTRMFEINPLFEKSIKKKGLFKKGLITKVARSGSIQNIKEIPQDMRKIFITAFDVPPRQHLLIQAAFQKHTDNSVSKTVNLAKDATVKDVKDIYLLAHKLRCKGITVYRYGSRKKQVLSFESEYLGSCVCIGDAFQGATPQHKSMLVFPN
ncbi:MAG: adenosylcobalamin-dependent ribonucleoside-diphosphate reductase [Candidatus Omnitrophota bacterium]|nr:MAG: adenosylcobalamin-dependent ribonucleoside-diphosphate reductase [Candidatus Omnitrophota bacterium]